MRSCYNASPKTICVSLALAAALWFMPSSFMGQDQNSPPPSAQPDNSAKNKVHDTTADQQSGAAADRMTTKKIRQAIVADHSLSTYAHNIKIIAQNGEVTLKGPVHSEDEKNSIAAKAAEVVGSQDKVHNDLTVKNQ